jgi:hypothetical protein
VLQASPAPPELFERVLPCLQTVVKTELLQIARHELGNDESAIEECGRLVARVTRQLEPLRPLAALRNVLLKALVMVDHGHDSIADPITAVHGMVCPGEPLKRPFRTRPMVARLRMVFLEAGTIVKSDAGYVAGVVLLFALHRETPAVGDCLLHAPEHHRIVTVRDRGDRHGHKSLLAFTGGRPRCRVAWHATQRPSDVSPSAETG